ncbi:MAG: precorrin-2 C(20)-methyltransferase [Spirulina sp. SIO3F2]|nr:precorrin-2 C(20)-methyltransferase [Spirulina sp. SIO3F2]
MGPILSASQLPGRLYGISVGTGDPELITLKGLRYLREADVVAFPSGRHGQPGIAEQIIAPWLAQCQVLLALEFPYVQDETVLQVAWKKAATEVWTYLKQGKTVAFACEGDVSFYSTFTYLAQALHHHHADIPMEIVPGVSSPYAAAAALRIPLTVWGQRYVVLPALHQLHELETVLAWAEVVVLLKVSSVYSQVWQILRQRNLLARSWVVERATHPNQVIYGDLSDRPTLQLSYFSLLIIHNSPPH